MTDNSKSSSSCRRAPSRRRIAEFVNFSSLFEEEEIPDAIAAPDPASKGSKSALQDDLDLFHKILDDVLRVTTIEFNNGC